MSPAFDIDGLQGSSLDLTLYWSGRLRVERLVQALARVGELHRWHGALIQVFELALRVRYRGRRRDDLRPPSGLAIRLARDQCVKWLGHLEEDGVQRRFEQPGEGAQGLVQQVGLILDDQAGEGVEKCLLAVIVCRVQPDTPLSFWAALEVPRLIRYAEPTCRRVPPRRRAEHAVDPPERSRGLTDER